MVKQVIVVRRDLNMGKGKLAAQVAHASMKVFLDLMRYSPHGFYNHTLQLNGDMKEWVEGLFTKIIVEVSSEEELLEVHQEALNINLPCALIQDLGFTEFHDVPTYTCVAIGPAKAEEIDKVTSNLKLL